MPQWLENIHTFASLVGPKHPLGLACKRHLNRDLYSCRTVALWFCNLDSDHKCYRSCSAKKLQITAQIFFCTLWRRISPLSSIVQANIFCSLNLDIFYYQFVYSNKLLTLKNFLYGLIYSLFLNLQSSDIRVDLIAENLKQASWLVYKDE
jgi:hypothetical protein